MNEAVSIPGRHIRPFFIIIIIIIIIIKPFKVHSGAQTNDMWHRPSAFRQNKSQCNETVNAYKWNYSHNKLLRIYTRGRLLAGLEALISISDGGEGRGGHKPKDLG